jgi:hypothetical protein
LLDAFPQPFFTLLVLGVALLAAGLVLHFLRERLSPPPSVPSPPPSPNPTRIRRRRPHSDCAIGRKPRRGIATAC